MAQYYDIHCHVFNKNVLVRGLVSIAQVLIEVADKEEVASTSHKIESLIENLKTLTQPESEDVFKVLDDAYDSRFVVTPLMLDLTYADDNDGRNERKDIRYRRRIKMIFFIIHELLPLVKRKVKPETKPLVDELRDEVQKFEDDFKVRSNDEVELFDDANYSQQILELEAMATKYAHVRPFFCIDPRRKHKDGENLIDLLTEKILNGKFVGVKLYAPVGFSPTDPALMGGPGDIGVYAFCIQHNIPITVHCSDSGFSCLSKELIVRGKMNLDGKIFAAPNIAHKFKTHFFGTNPGEAIHERAYALNHPKLWQLVMDKYPNLTINFAHFGGSGPLMEYIKYDIPEDKYKKRDFEEALEKLAPHEQKKILAGFDKKMGKMHLKDNLTLEERQSVWMGMYQVGLIDNWAKAIFDIVRNPAYKNAFTDLSCFSEGEMVDPPGDGVNKKVFSVEKNLKLFKRSIYDKLSPYEQSKILYGSDYFLIRFFGAEMRQYVTDFKAAFGTDFDAISSKHPEAFLKIR